jgi:ribosomal protein S18 acetylase RimI-like enzyme
VIGYEDAVFDKDTGELRRLYPTETNAYTKPVLNKFTGKIMGYMYRMANADDLKFITEIRIEVLRAANNLENNVNMDNVFNETYKYYSNNLQNNIITYLAFDDNVFIGCGSICFYNIMPTYCNQSGKKAYIMNMYTRNNYRRKGIAKNILNLLIKEAENRGINQIQLEATEMGKKLYENYGFEELKNEMELKI